jgi:hypothetical protein
MVTVLLTLEPGAVPGNVLKALFDQKTNLQSHYGNLDGYLQWTLDTARMLRGQVSSSDIERLVFRPTLWRFHDLRNNLDHFAYQLLSQEMQEQKALLDQVYSALQAEVNRWKSDDGRLIVVDTSVFIHHADKIADIDYAKIVGARFVPVRLVVPRVVVDELDRLKESGNEQSRWRAGHTLGVLDGLLREPRSRAVVRQRDEDWSDTLAVNEIPRDEVTVEVLFDDPRHVRLNDNDDEIIDRTLALKTYQGPVPGAAAVCLLTMDTSMALRARMVGLTVYKESKPLSEEPPDRSQRSSVPRRRQLRGALGPISDTGRPTGSGG